MKNSLLLRSFLAVCFSLTVLVSGAQSYGKYTLYATMNGTNAYLIDTNNNVYHTWTFAANMKTGYSSYLLPGRVLLRSVARQGNSFTGGPICGEVQKVAWDGTVLWDYVYSTTTYCTHHDIYPMPNGNVLLIAYESKTGTEASNAGSTQAITMWPDKIVEVQPSGANGGTIVWEWHAWDHLMQNVDAQKANYVTSLSAHPELLNINYRTQKDWLHMNGVSYNDSLDQIAFSCHNMDEIYVIDHSTTTAEAASHAGGNSGKGGDILYRWGNPAAYGATGTAVLNVVHDAHFVRRDCKTCPNANQLAGFNNNGISMNQSAVDFIDPPYNGYNYSITPGQAYLPATYTDRISCTGHASNMGCSQSLPNGNVLICVATSGYIYEVDSLGNTVWSKTVTGSVPKAWRYTECYVDSTAPTPTITQSGDTLTSSSGATYQWYKDSVLIPGATSQTYIATQSGNYQVVITVPEGCVSDYSNPVTVTISVSVTGDLDRNTFRIYPNPAQNVLNILSQADAGTDWSLMITDTFGKCVLRSGSVSQVDISALPQGLYFVTVLAGSKGAYTEKIVVNR